MIRPAPVKQLISRSGTDGCYYEAYTIYFLLIHSGIVTDDHLEEAVIAVLPTGNETFTLIS